MKDVLIISNYWHFEPEKSSSRYLTIANMVAEADMNVEMITSSFYHAEKTQRKYEKSYFDGFKYKTTLIFEPGYQKNVSLKRIISHKIFARNVMKYLKQRKKPDVIYCFVPSLDMARRVTQYANKMGIRIVIDILDLWPEAYKMVFKIPLLDKLIFAPLTYKANKIYRSADEIVAVSDTYVKRALEVSEKCKEGHSILIGADINYFDQFIMERSGSNHHEGDIWIAYIGMLGHSYDIRVVIDALKIIEDRGISNIKFVVMGDGPLRQRFESYAKHQGIDVDFTGRLSYGEMVNRLTACDIAVNPITRGAAQTIINKHADYVAAGLPILNTQECQEFKDLLIEYKAGINCENNNAMDLAENIMKLSQDENLCKTMGKNSRRLAEEKFDRRISYSRIVELIRD
jgi:glycosyltransferase involved in cell wall biosynthesis